MPKRLKPLSGLGDTNLRTAWFFQPKYSYNAVLSINNVHLQLLHYYIGFEINGPLFHTFGYEILRTQLLSV
jgi:hypothetical protein